MKRFYPSLLKKLRKTTIKEYSLCLLMFISLVQPSIVLSKIVYMDQLSLSIGMVMNSFTQVQEAIEGEAKSGASDSMLSADLNYEIFQFRNMSHVFKMTGSGVLMNTIDKYYGVGYGVRWYFGSEGTRVILKDKVVDLQLTPKFRYYAGANIGGYYMVYRPEPGGEEIRNDIGVETGGHAGVMYGNHHKRSYKAQLNFLMGSGAETSSTIIQFFVGTTFYLEPLL